MRMVVVLPEPFGPRKPTISPRATLRSTSSTTVLSPKRLGQAVHVDDVGRRRSPLITRPRSAASRRPAGRPAGAPPRRRASPRRGTPACRGVSRLKMTGGVNSASRAEERHLRRQACRAGVAGDGHRRADAQARAHRLGHEEYHLAASCGSSDSTGAPAAATSPSRSRCPRCGRASGRVDDVFGRAGSSPEPAPRRAACTARSPASISGVRAGIAATSFWRSADVDARLGDGDRLLAPRRAAPRRSTGGRRAPAGAPDRFCALFERGLRLGDLRLDDGDLRRTLALLQVGKLRLGARELRLDLARRPPSPPCRRGGRAGRRPSPRRRARTGRSTMRPPTSGATSTKSPST